MSFISWLIYSALEYEPKWGEGGCWVLTNEYSCAYGAQIHFGDLTPYLTYEGGGLAGEGVGGAHSDERRNPASTSEYLWVGSIGVPYACTESVGWEAEGGGGFLYLTLILSNPHPGISSPRALPPPPTPSAQVSPSKLLPVLFQCATHSDIM